MPGTARKPREGYDAGTECVMCGAGRDVAALNTFPCECGCKGMVSMCTDVDGCQARIDAMHSTRRR